MLAPRLSGEHWLGLPRLIALTAQGARELRAGLVKESGEVSYSQYSGFTVDAAPGYALRRGAQTKGTAGGGFTELYGASRLKTELKLH